MARTTSVQALRLETAKALKGSARWLCMARTVHALGAGGPRHAARALGWGRMPMRQETHARESGCICREAFAARGRQRVEAHLPHLVPAIRAMVERPRPAAPQGRPNRLSPRVSAAAVRQPLLVHTGSPEAA